MPEQTPHHDPFQSFQEEANDVPKMPPSEIRRLGNRRRTTRRMGIAGGIAAVAVAAVTAVALNLPGLSDGSPEIGGTPSVSTSSTPAVTPSPTPIPSPTTLAPTATQPTWANVPGVALMFPQDPSTGVLAEQYEGLGQAGLGMCDPGDPRLALQNPSEDLTILTRTFDWIDGTGANVGRTVRVLGFTSVDSATRAYDLYSSTAKDCGTRYQTDPEFTTPSTYDAGTDLPFDGSIARQPARAAYYSMMLLRKNSDTGRFNDTMVIQAGHRVMLVTSTFDGMDHNCGVQTGSAAGQCDFALVLSKLVTLLDQ